MIEKSVFIGIDIGTSITKGIAITSTGDVLSSCSIVHSYESKTDRAVSWWDEIQLIIRDLLANIQKDSIQAITISGMIPNIIMLDNRGKIVESTRMFNDDFAVGIEHELDSADGTKWMNEFLSKLIYLRRTVKEWDKIKHILTSHTYCVYKLTGKYICDYGTAMECGHTYNFQNKCWNEAILSKYDIDVKKLPSLVSPISLIGNIKTNVAEKLGISKNVKIIAGSHDSVASAIGAGLNLLGDSLIYYGTYNCSAVLKDDMINFLKGHSTINPIQWTVSIPRSGKQVDQFVEFFCGKGKYDEFSSSVSQSSKGANGVLFIQNANVLKSGISEEPIGTFDGIKLSSRKEDLCRAVFESFGYAIRAFWKYDKTDKPHLLYAAGGGTKSKLWMQIISDIIQTDQIILEKAENAIGTAIMGICAHNDNALAKLKEERLKSSLRIVHNKSVSSYEQQFHRYYTIVSKQVEDCMK